MVAMFIGEIGILDRKDMDHFAKIFLSFQKLGKSKKPAGKFTYICLYKLSNVSFQKSKSYGAS
jgi:hypothetical protein